jgi:hypothetical protein
MSRDYKELLGIVFCTAIILIVAFSRGTEKPSAQTYTPQTAESGKTDWNKEFQPGETWAFEAKDVVLSDDCTSVTLRVKGETFQAKIPVEIKDAKECREIWNNHMMKWDSTLKAHSGFSDNTVYVSRLDDFQKPDEIIVDIKDGQPAIKALPIDDWINNGYAIPTIPIPSGDINYSESLLYAMTYNDKGIWKDSPKPKFQERDLVVSKDEPTIVWQIIFKGFAKDKKDTNGNAVGFENGWYYDCMELLGGKLSGKHFKCYGEADLTAFVEVKGESK